MNKLLDHAFDWLQSQPGMRPWPQGQARIIEHIHQWGRQYSEAVCDFVPSDETPLWQGLVEKLWQCWEYHWRQAIELEGGPVDGFVVASQLVAGQGYIRGGRLGGNPLEDVVLAVAVLRQEPVAIERFAERFQNKAIRVAMKSNPRVAEDEQDWWCQLLVHLMGVGDRRGKLQKYAGHCGLWNWLVRVAKNFSVRWGSVLPCDSEPLERLIVLGQNSAEESECQKLLGGAIRDVIGHLSPDQGTLLYLLFAENLPGKDVATILGVHPGSISRQKDKAIGLLHEALATIDGPPSRSQAYRDCLESLTGTRNWRELAGVFLTVLQQYRPDGAETVHQKEVDP